MADVVDAKSPIDDELTDPDELFGLPLDEFVKARDALAKVLRKQGHKQRATEMAARRRPSVAAWALNQVARHDAATVERAIGVGERLREATADAVAGDATALRAAHADERLSVDALTRAAAAVLRDAGTPPSAATTQRITDTIRAALADETISDQLRLGRLVVDHVASGFGFALGGEPAAIPRPAAARPAPDKTQREKTERETSESETCAREKIEREAAAREEAARRAAEWREAVREHRARQRHAEELADAADEAEATAQVARDAANEAAAAIGPEPLEPTPVDPR
jgi:hypothetical protein